jgi:8-oxo-dGTP pyrophosphatase MutT (NUDIX family)
MQEKSAGTIVFRGDEVLLLHYIAGHWDFPKGNIESGEKEEETALRELEEETGIKHAEVIPGFREEIVYFYRRRGMTIRKTVIFFLVKTSESEVRISHEHIGFKWLPYEEAMKQLTFENARLELKKAREFINKSD